MVVVAYEILVSPQGSLVLGFLGLGLWGLGPGLDNLNKVDRDTGAKYTCLKLQSHVYTSETVVKTNNLKEKFMMILTIQSQIYTV